MKYDMICDHQRELEVIHGLLSDFCGAGNAQQPALDFASIIPSTTPLTSCGSRQRGAGSGRARWRYSLLLGQPVTRPRAKQTARWQRGSARQV